MKRMKIKVYLFVLWTAIAVLAAPGAFAQEATGFAVIGDSNSDEYQTDDARGGTFSGVTFNWVEHLAMTRGLDFGPLGTWGEPRRSGYEYNWARTDAGVEEAIAQGQHTGVANQITAGEVSHALVWLGFDDFSVQNGSYGEIYDGTLTDVQVQAKIDALIAGMVTIVDTLIAAGGDNIVVVSIGDPGISGEVQANFPDPAQRQRVSDAIDEVNAGWAQIANDRPEVVFVDFQAFQNGIVADVVGDGTLDVAGIEIDATSKSNDPSHLLLNDADGHPGTVLSGLIANNIFVEPMNLEFGQSITPLTEEEIVTKAGLTPGEPTPTPTPGPGPTPTPTPDPDPDPDPDPTPGPGVGNSADGWEKYR